MGRVLIGSYFTNQYKDSYEIKKFSFLQDNFEALHVKAVDVVFHLSALVHQMGGASAEAYENVNVTQTLQLARKAKESGVRHFVFMSTVKVYGEESDEVYTESFTCKPQDEYGKSKLKAENALLKLEDESFKVSIIRTPIVYGYGVKANIKNLTHLIAKIPILPFGGISNRRSFVYVGNLCALVDMIIQTSQGGIFLASDDRALSTTELIKLIASAMHKKIYLLAIPLFPTLLKWLKPSLYKRLFQSLEVDNAQTKKILGFENPYSAEEGIRMMIEGDKQ
ncbi:MAG: NAD-dependent epimerase/dehydratase family protein [Sulfurospirillaceae bacterium]|nr:NAD-dependent epimerase/dehydratase family protein [Sulfurospirillaceae bacterium]MDD2826361.1 NAD-dependent epimerase/dehydratase family protein [Sulfurospirillaceae bacterium]